MINPQDLQNTDFSKSFKGYSCTEVDKYVEYVVEQYTELYREYAELEKKVKILGAKLEEAKNDQSSVSATLLNAQKMADEIIKDANNKANAINGAIKESFDEIVEQYRTVIANEQKKLLEAQKNAIDFKVGILDGYKDQIKMLCELIPLDSMDDVNIRSVDEVVENAISGAGAKLGVKPENEEDVSEETETESENA
ncbi:MAG: DivIVA domain-containing protein [Ruminococcaceae bacterium]|nr:DivIVA domain-containing protein [Oscillospiraceae bacterium]